MLPTPKRLSNEDYQVIKGGACVEGGTYDGCIMVRELLESLYYWVSPLDKTNWQITEGEPGPAQVKVGPSVWDACKDGGTLDWDARGEYWEDPTAAYRWADNGLGDICLVELG